MDDVGATKTLPSQSRREGQEFENATFERGDFEIARQHFPSPNSYEWDHNQNPIESYQIYFVT